MSLVETGLIDDDALFASIISTGGGISYDMLSITNPCNTTASNTAYSTAFFDKDNNEVLKFTPDGEIFWRGKLIEMDSDIRQAVLDIRRLLVLNGFRNL